MSALSELLAHKAAANEAYKAKDLTEAIAGYSKAISLLPVLGEPNDSDDEENTTPRSAVDGELLTQGAIVLCNRAAAYMGENKPIPALADAQRASDFDPDNWKSHWRCDKKDLLDAIAFSS